MLALLACLRRAAALLDLLAFTLFMLLVALLPHRIARSLYRICFAAWCRSFVRALGVKLALHQHYAGALPKQYILIANHPSAFEDIGIPALFPVRSLAKAEVADWWVLGRIAVAAGTLFVKRESSASRKAATQAMIDAVRQGDNLALYPEGGCKGRRIGGHFFNGAFVTSLETGIPILPVFLYYPAQAAFEWDNQHLLTKLWEIAISPNPCAEYHVFNPIDPANFETPEAMKDHAYRLYLAWQSRFLD
ncbi:MAG: 1-acyl-sn-glycerol-3-phosphate acyltransferase [Burkholderiales bacterium]|nr:1-acyl-sn-glycerol-3-phosphate acyltransferase [Burkholderiales bacterium]